MGNRHVFLPAVTKGNNSCDLLFAYKDDAALTLLHSEWPKLHRVLAVLSAVGFMKWVCS